jgi:hypothetical protein
MNNKPAKPAASAVGARAFDLRAALLRYRLLLAMILAAATALESAQLLRMLLLQH